MPRHRISEFDRQLRRTIALNLKKYTANITQGRLSEMTGIPASTLSGYFAERSTPGNEQVQKIADALNLNKSDIDPIRFKSTNSEKAVTAPKREPVKIPILGSVVAGAPLEAIENIIGYEEITPELAAKGEYFALEIKGASMEPKLYEGDIVIIKTQTYCDSGDIAIVLVNGNEATVKKVVFSPSGITLIGFNANVYPPHLYTAEEVQTLPVTIVGKVIESRRRY